MEFPTQQFSNRLIWKKDRYTATTSDLKLYKI